MGFLGPLIAGSLLAIVESFVARVIASLGVGVVSYVGISSSLNWLKSAAVTSFTSLPTEVISMLSLMQVGSCVSMVFSAISMRLVLQGLTSDTLKSWVKK